MVEDVIKKSSPSTMLYAKSNQDAKLEHGLFGKLDPSTTIEQRFDIKCCLMKSEENSHIVCFLHQCSKVLEMFCETETFKMIQPKVNQTNFELAASIFVLNEEVELFLTWYLLHLFEDLIVLSEHCLTSVPETLMQITV